MRQIRQIVATAACLIGAAVLGWRTVAHQPPSKAQLMIIEGVISQVSTVKRSSKYHSATHPVLRILGRTEGYAYLDWFPDPEQIVRTVKAGDRVRLLSDTPNGNRWVWQIEKDGQTIVRYEQVLAAVRANNRHDPYLALVLGIAGLVGLRSLFKSWREEPAHAPEPDRQNV